MNTIAAGRRLERLILFPLLILFVLSLVLLNRQLLLAGRRMDSMVDSYEKSRQEWTRIRTVIILGGRYNTRTPVDVLGDLERMRSWLGTPELGRLSRFSSIALDLTDIQSELVLVPELFAVSADPQHILKITRIDDGLSDIRSAIVEFRDKLDRGFAFLVQSQTYLILMLVILVIMQQENRMRNKLKFRMAVEMQGRIVQAQEEERNRIALDLHDEIAQELSWMSINLVNRNVEPAFLVVMDQLVKNVRDMSEYLRAPDFSTESFNDAVRDMIALTEGRSGIKARFLPRTISSGLRPVLYGHVYRITQECLSNSQKHAGSCRVFIEIQEDENLLYYEYRDDGAGFDMESDLWKENMGLRGIRNRILMMEGSLSISASPGKGMALRFRTHLGSKTGET
jgi:signal transduction histidine kinase